MLRSGFYTSFVTFALLAARTRRGGTLLAAVWHMLGITISLSALLAVCGGLPVPYAVAYTQSPGVSATGARLAGLLQYPNAFGAVMAVYLLERLFAAAYSFGSGDSGKAEDGEKNGALGGVAVAGVDKGDAGSSAVRASVSGVDELGAEGADAGNNAERMDVSGAGEVGAEGSGTCSNSSARAGVSRAGKVGGGAGTHGERTRTWSAAHWLRAARLLPLFPYAAALLLSESRGAWLGA
ncbi:O-antigen polymerase, partial [Paenibacillus sp. FSL R7-269]